MASFEVWATIVASFLIEPLRTKVGDLSRDYRYMKDECGRLLGLIDRLGPVLKALQREERRVESDSPSSTRDKDDLLEDYKNALWEDLEDTHSVLLDAERCAQSALGRWRATGKLRKAVERMTSLLESPSTRTELVLGRPTEQAVAAELDLGSSPPAVRLRVDEKLYGEEDDCNTCTRSFRQPHSSHVSESTTTAFEEESVSVDTGGSVAPQQRSSSGGGGGGGGSVEEGEEGDSSECRKPRTEGRNSCSDKEKEFLTKGSEMGDDGWAQQGHHQHAAGSERYFGISKQIERIAKELVDSERGVGKIVCVLGPSMHDQTPSESAFSRGKASETTLMMATSSPTTTTNAAVLRKGAKGASDTTDMATDTACSPKSGVLKDRWVREVKRWEGIDSSGRAESGQVRSATLGATGMAGVGKSTLARNVVKLPAVHSYFEDGLYWLSIGQQGDILSLQSSVWRDICGSDRVFIPFEEEDEGLRRLAGRLKGKRVLLVLDDVWTHRQLELLSVVDMAAGSRILLTTRKEEVLFQKCGGNMLVVHRMQLLRDADAIGLFCWEAFGRAELPSSERRAKMATSVCRMCGGLPLALKMVGRSLRKADEEKWEWTCRLLREAKRTEVRVRIFRDDVRLMAILRCMLDSLDRLDIRLRFLFLDLAAFPEHFAIPVRTLLRIWAVDSLVGSVEEAARLLWLLAQRAIVRLHEGRIGGPGGDEWAARDRCRGDDVMMMSHAHAGGQARRTSSSSTTAGVVAVVPTTGLPGAAASQRSHSLTCSVHNAVRDLALSEIERVQSKHSRWKHVFFPGCRDQGTLLLRTFTNAVRLSLHSSHITSLPADIAMPKLQVLLASENPIDRFPRSGFKDITALRVLDLESCRQIRNLPSCFGKLRHLKVLNLRCCSSLEALPSGVGGLRELEVLDCSHCTDLKGIPDCISKCSSLRTLHFDGCCSLRTVPLSLSLLRELQILDLRNCCLLERFAHQSDGGGGGGGSCPPTAGHDMFSSLSELDMSGCTDLQVFPDYGDGSFPRLGSLRFAGCVKLQCLPKSLRFCKELVELDVSNCLSLYIVPIELDYSRPDSFPNLTVINDDGLRASVQTLFARILRKNLCPDAYLFL